MEALRKLPATRRFTFYLDPQLHYAVRRLDQSYGTDTLLSRARLHPILNKFPLAANSGYRRKRVETQLHE